ncbi:MAG: TadE/TadG family type IV pilus assembly protein [Phycisphaerae bacterium]|nr:TadE/TadG family type IV pilus assembly protein [Phycisphaerae bacterium]
MKQWMGTKRRRGAAAVEMALVTPLLLTMLFGIIEYGWVFSVRQTLTHAAREGARVAVLQGTDEDDITDRIDAVLAPYGITSHTITMEHATTDDPTETVRVQVPYADITLIGEYFGNTTQTLGAVASMRKEGVD